MKIFLPFCYSLPLFEGFIFLFYIFPLKSQNLANFFSAEEVEFPSKSLNTDCKVPNLLRGLNMEFRAQFCKVKDPSVKSLWPNFLLK